MSDLLAEIAKVASIFGLAWFSFWSAIPAGLVLGLHPLLIIFVTTISYISGILIVILPGERVQQWVKGRFAKGINEQSNTDTLIRRIWDKYGVIGFGLVAPMTIGAQIGALLGLALNIPVRRLVLWMSLGVLAWSIGLTLLAVMGIIGLNAVT